MFKWLKPNPNPDMLSVGLRMLKLSFMRIGPGQIDILQFLKSTILIVIFVSSLVNLTQNDRMLFFRSIETAVTMFHAGIKWTILIYYNGIFVTFLNNKNRFWTFDRCDDKLRDRANAVKRTVYKLLLGYALCSICTVTAYCSKSVLNSDDPLVFVGWTPKGSIYLYMLASFDWLFMYFFGLIVTGFDCLYIALTTDLILQFKLLKYEFNALYKSEYHDNEYARKKNLSAYIEYHNFLHRVYLDMRQVYSSLFLIQYFITLISNCTQLYIISTSDTSNLIDIVKTASYVNTMLFELAMYCFPAEYLRDEIMEISDAIFHSKWYHCSPQMKKDLMCVMRKVQSTEGFSGLGLLDVGVPTFTMVIRQSFSFYMILRSLLQKDV